MPVSLLLFAMAMAPGPADAPTAQTEMLGTDVPDAFQVGNQARNDKMEIIEMVQPPETVNDWSKLVTLQLFYGGARIGLDTFHARWRDAMRRSCPGATDSVTKGSVDARPAIRSRFFCPNNPLTRKPEALNAVLVQGDANLMLVQVAFRHAIASEDEGLITRIETSLKVCDQRNLSACSARKATGFRVTP